MHGINRGARIAVNFRFMILHISGGVQRGASEARRRRAAVGKRRDGRLKFDFRAKPLARQELAKPGFRPFAGEGVTPPAVCNNVKRKELREKRFVRV